jgi:hypothetical protein
MHKKIKITNLVVNIDNPRYEMVGNQQEAIGVMVRDQGKKLINLASDLIQKGINPSEFPIVVPHEKEKGHFIVLEGNRRVVALKLLHNPEMVKDQQAIYKKVKSLSHKSKTGQINEIECVVFSSVHEANPWIKLKHTGENDGVGVVKWDAQQTARFDERMSGKSPVALQAIDFLRKTKEVSKEFKDQLKKVPSTNLDRLLKDKGMQEFLGVAIIDGRLQTNIPESEVAKGLAKIVNDLAQGKIKVKDIYTKEDREKYMQKFSRQEIPQKHKKTKSPWELASQKEGSQKSSSARKKAHSFERQTLIPKDCILKITDKRINKIYGELRSLQCDGFENAVAVLFRVFIELSMDAFLEKNKTEAEFSKVTINSKLKQKVMASAAYFKKRDFLTDQQLKPIQVAVSDQNNFLAVETFHAYVHNRHFSPLVSDLKKAWDNIQPFIEKVWE